MLVNQVFCYMEKNIQYKFELKEPAEKFLAFGQMATSDLRCLRALSEKFEAIVMPNVVSIFFNKHKAGTSKLVFNESCSETRI